MSYHANVAAALHFAQEVLPYIWAKAPEVKFQIVGKDPPEVVRRLVADERIQVTGTVKDLRPYLAQATVVVCPVQYAVGVQNKVLEAMAMAKPVVCTSAALAGLDAKEDREALIARAPEEFAEQVLQVCSNASLAQRLARAGRRYVESHHSWENTTWRLTGVYELARFEEHIE
jgi:glycosyltransferase involved in cell wall biosynthesis